MGVDRQVSLRRFASRASVPPRSLFSTGDHSSALSTSPTIVVVVVVVVHDNDVVEVRRRRRDGLWLRLWRRIIICWRLRRRRRVWRMRLRWIICWLRRGWSRCRRRNGWHSSCHHGHANRRGRHRLRSDRTCVRKLYFKGLAFGYTGRDDDLEFLAIGPIDLNLHATANPRGASDGHEHVDL